MNRLKIVREQKNLLQSDVASFLGITPQAYGLYENEKRDIPPKFIIALAKYFGVTTDYLLGLDKVDEDMIKIGLSMKDYAPPTKEQRKQIEDFVKFVLKKKEN